MKNIVSVLVACLVLTGCTGSSKSTEDRHQPHAPLLTKPSESLLTTEDMDYCEQQLEITLKTVTDVYAISGDVLEKVKGCAFDREKHRMPLLADLIDKYRVRVQQGNKDCAQDIGTPQGSLCIRNNLGDAAAWYNLAVNQRVSNLLPNQPQLQMPELQH